MISKDEILRFIKLGEIKHFRQEVDASSIVGLHIKLRPNEWEELGRILNHDELKSLIRGIIHFTIAGGHSGGSVSPIIQLFRAYAERFPLQEPELCTWITENRSNDYEPFGTWDHGGARTLAEFEEYQNKKEVVRDKRLQADLDKQSILKEAKLKREKVAATQNLWNAVRRGDVKAVEALLIRGADWESVVNERGSLVNLARKNSKNDLITFLESKGIN